MLGYVVVPADAKAEADALLADIADRLAAEGLRLVGAVQTNSGPEGDCRCDMDLRLLHDGRVIRISQTLGMDAGGCRLDPGALEEVAQAVTGALATTPDLLVLNKFGKQEALGRGHRPVIAAALDRGVPVLLAVAEEVLPDFFAFADGMAEALSPGDTESWARRIVPARVQEARRMDILPAEIEVDARGLLCPLPVLRLHKRLLAAEAGQVVRLLATDPAAAIDVPHFCAESGHRLIDSTALPHGGTAWRVRAGA